MMNHSRVGNGSCTFGAVKNRDRNSPNPLSRNTPVRATLKHVAHAVDTPGRYPIHIFNLTQRGSSQGCCRRLRQVVRVVASISTVFILLNRLLVRLVHRDEPLWCRPENHGVLAPPTMRVTVIVILREKEHSSLLHELNDLFVGLKNTLARKVFDFRSKPSRVIDGSINIQAVALADDEVVMTMTWSSMHSTRSSFAVGRFLLCFPHVEFSFGVRFATKCHVLANHQQRRAINPGMSTLKPIQF